MNRQSPGIAAGILVATVLLGPALPLPARAAQSYDNCKGFITTLPTTISTQGVWCLKGDLGTAITTGSAITIAANNVTIDCNDFKLGGLAAGDGSQASGIYASNRQNATVRHCNIRGFHDGVFLNNGAGNLIEDNRFDNNLHIGILVLGSDNIIRRNLVFATGGAPDTNGAIGIEANADVIDNTVSGVFGTTTDTYPYGIDVLSDDSEISGNRVRGLVVAGAGRAYGIAAAGTATTASGNRIANDIPVAGTALLSAGDGDFCLGNTAYGYSATYAGCTYATGNLP